mgnify:CR=1 FL=1
MIATSRNGVAVSLPCVFDAETTKIIGTVNIAAGQTVGTITTVTTVTSLTQMNGQAISMGTGVRDAGTQRITVATDDSVPVTGTFWQATQPVSGTFWQATQPVSGTFWQATQPVSGTVTANPATSAGKTITYVSVNQGGAGTTVLAAASVGNKHKLLGAVLVLSLTGTLKFTDDGGDLSGPMDLAANGGFVMMPSAFPITETGATNRALNLVTTLGAARGVVAILTEP